MALNCQFGVFCRVFVQVEILDEQGQRINKATLDLPGPLNLCSTMNPNQDVFLFRTD